MSMKKLISLMAALCLLLVSCEKKDPVDPAKLNQPEDPATWSPVGKKYVSIDIDTMDGRFKGWTVEFISGTQMKRTFGKYNHTEQGRYRMNYPKVYLGDSETPWYKFIDTLTLTRFYDMSDCPTFKLVTK